MIEELKELTAKNPLDGEEARAKLLAVVHDVEGCEAMLMDIGRRLPLPSAAEARGAVVPTLTTAWRAAAARVGGSLADLGHELRRAVSLTPGDLDLLYRSAQEAAHQRRLKRQMKRQQRVEKDPPSKGLDSVEGSGR